MTDDRPTLAPTPLRRSDPPQLGDVVLVGRLSTSDAGYVYAGWAGEQRAAVVVLSDGADADSYGRTRFLHQVGIAESDPEHALLAAESDPEVAPWVAVAVPSWEAGRQLGRELLAPVTLGDVPHSGPVQGPDYRPHWHERAGVGRWRLWPLPWPSALGGAGRWTYLASFALVLLIATLALWVAVEIFEDQPSPPPPAPNPPGPTPPSPTDVPTPSIPTPSGPSPTTPSPTGETSIPPIV